MLKKSLFIFLVCLCCVNIAYGDCVYKQPKDNSPSDEDIFFTDKKPKYSEYRPDALVCGTQGGEKYCENNTWIYVDAEHFNTNNGKQSSGLYSCSVNNVNTTWNLRLVSEIKDKYLKPCEQLAGYEKVDIPNYTGDLEIYGEPIEGGKAYVNLCYEKVSANSGNKDISVDRNVALFNNPVDATSGFECEPDNYYIKTDIDDPANIYKCDADKNLSESEYYLLPCFDVADAKPSSSAPEGFTPYGTKTNYRTYLNTDKVSHVTGNDNIYPWSDDKTVMCWWCNSTDDWFATVNQAGNMECFNNEEKAWCFYAINKEGKNAVWDDNSGECKCLTNGETWKDHTCKTDNNAGTEQGPCDPYEDGSETKKCCEKAQGDDAIVEMIMENETYKSCKCKDETKEWKNNNCEEKSTLTQEKADAAKKVVQQFVKNTSDKASKWKDVEGNFNTARLASDLTAGVVLGTVGGVVSGVVIKKKQIEKGFEVLHCAIGGQSVADWGDTFTIGLKRY